MQTKSRLLEHAKRMRCAPTDAESALWRHLRAGRLAGRKFRRQQPIGPYIVDFVCFTAKLVVEVDGGQHADQSAHDERRTAWLRSQGFRVVRCWNDDALLRTEWVMDEVLRLLDVAVAG